MSVKPGQVQTTLAHDEPRAVIGGVDTHKDAHVAAVIDDLGRILGVETFAATPPRLPAPPRLAARAR